VKYKISDLEIDLNSLGFVRIHRSFLVNSKEINALGNTELIIESFSVPVGRSYKSNYEELKRKHSI